MAFFCVVQCSTEHTEMKATADVQVYHSHSRRIVNVTVLQNVWLCVVNVSSWHQSNVGHDLSLLEAYGKPCVLMMLSAITSLIHRVCHIAWCLYSYPDNFRECDRCDVTLYYYLRCSRLHSWSVLCGIIKTCDNVIMLLLLVSVVCYSLLRAHRYKVSPYQHFSRLMLYFKILFCTFRLDTIKLSRPTPVCIFPLNWILNFA